MSPSSNPAPDGLSGSALKKPRAAVAPGLATVPPSSSRESSPLTKVVQRGRERGNKMANVPTVICDLIPRHAAHFAAALAGDEQQFKERAEWITEPVE